MGGNQVIPEAAATTQHHWLLFEDDGKWGCTVCDFTGEKIEDYWTAHEARPDHDNIPF